MFARVVPEDIIVIHIEMMKPDCVLLFVFTILLTPPYRLKFVIDPNHSLNLNATFFASISYNMMFATRMV